MLSKTIIVAPLILLSIPTGRANSSLSKTAEAFSDSSRKTATRWILNRSPVGYDPKHTTIPSKAQPPPKSNYHYKLHDRKSKPFLSRSSDEMTEMTTEIRGGEMVPSFNQKLIAEAIGTFLIVHIGCGVVCSAIYKSAQQGLWQIAAVWSIAVSLAIYTTAGISGAHLNPAISIAMKMCRPSDHQDMGWSHVAGYCLAQTVGAVIGASVNLALFWESIQTFESQNGIVRGAVESVASAAAFGEYWSVSSWKQAFFAESMGTFILSFLIFSLTHPRNDAVPKNVAPLLIGATVGALISVIAPLTQGGFNPARDFGPRIVSWLAGWGRSVAMQGWWVYVFAPIVGAVAGGFVAEKVLWKEQKKED